jgi:hypothetical protein
MDKQQNVNANHGRFPPMVFLKLPPPGGLEHGVGGRVKKNSSPNALIIFSTQSYPLK